MITLKKDNVVMEVENEYQASAFLKSGYTRVDKSSTPEAVEAAVETPKEEPKRRRRKAAE